MTNGSEGKGGRSNGNGNGNGGRARAGGDGSPRQSQIAAARLKMRLVQQRGGRVPRWLADLAASPLNRKVTPVAPVPQPEGLVRRWLLRLAGAARRGGNG